jgi:phosphotransferase system HPr (HPr) family protein
MPASSDVVVAATLPAAVALHARPAARFVQLAASYPCSLTVAANGRRANAKSILDVLALGATGGTELELAASGDGAAEAVEQLAALVAGLVD